ncbi:MAG TPA: cation-translocating P-type ATPase, partial [Clostridia bacterium]|nr:cation-translocating P-type ATPase [Clostridia bacterium]
LIIGIPVLVTAVGGFLKKDVGASMEILVSVAMIMAVLDGQYTLAILIPIVLTLVHFLEEKSIMGGKDAIEGLKKMQAETALLLSDDEEKEVDAKTLAVGDIIILKPGMSLPIDGTVIKGSSSIDQKSLTGEALPKEVKTGDNVFAGTTNIEGLLHVKVDKIYKDTSFQRIVQLLEHANTIDLPETRIVDKFMMYYIPLALVTATLVWLLTNDISKAIAMLVVSCPCGHMLVSSAPMISALAAATKRGILIKNASFIEKLAEVDYVVFDKTGTITSGTLEAVKVYLADAQSEEELFSVAASVANSSLHPTSKSIMLLCGDTEYEKGYEITEMVGKGVKGSKGDDDIYIGNYRYISSLGYDVTDEYELDGTSSWIIKNGSVLGCILFRDVQRKGAQEAVADLKKLGVKETCLLTGDNCISAQRIVDVVKIDTMYCELLPEQKLEKVKAAQKDNTVAVVGDGINDALALSEADVGIAMGAMGSDTAIQSADIALMNNNLDNIPFIIKLAEKTRGIIYQNIIIAFAISFVMIFLAASGAISAIAGAFLHNIGAFIVLVNSGRIMNGKFKADTDIRL